MTPDRQDHDLDPTKPLDPTRPNDPLMPTVPPQIPPATPLPADEEPIVPIVDPVSDGAVPVSASSITELLVRESISDEENRLTSDLHIEKGHTVSHTVKTTDEPS